MTLDTYSTLGLAMVDETILTETEERHYWRLRWLSALQAFTDGVVQASRWTDPEEENPQYSFVECMCRYFDDADLADEDSYARRIARGYLTVEEANTVAEFHLFADQYRSPGGDDYDVDAILGDPAWRIVVEAALRAQASLLLRITDACEVAALTIPLTWKKVSAGSFNASYPDRA